jgi:hypothetical protein
MCTTAITQFLTCIAHTDMTQAFGLSHASSTHSLPPNDQQLLQSSGELDRNNSGEREHVCLHITTLAHISTLHTHARTHTRIQQTNKQISPH